MNTKHSDLETIRKRNSTINKLRAKVRYLELLVAEIDMALEGTERDGLVDAIRADLESE